MTAENKESVAVLYEQGMNPEDIAEELGLDEIEVINVCEELLNK